MNTEIVEKYINGELDDAAFNAEFEKLDAPAKAEISKALKEAKPKILEEISGLRQERNKVKEQKKVEAEKDTSEFISKFRGSQVKKAIDRLVKEKGLAEADKATLESNFAKMDDGDVDVDDIYSNLKRAYGYTFADKLMEEADHGSSGAADYTSRQAGSAGINAGPPEIKEDDPRVTRILAEARAQGIPMTKDEAIRGMAAGAKKSGGAWNGLKPLPKA